MPYPAGSDATVSGAPVRNASWPEARRLAYAAAAPSTPFRVQLDEALRSVLAEPVMTLTDLPAFDTVSMDGWAVAGPGPWQVTQQVLAGQQPSPLPPGEAAEVATGSQFPPGADAVLRREDGKRSGSTLRCLLAGGIVSHHRDIRLQGEEAKSGEVVLGSGFLVTPPVLGLAAAAGHDELLVRLGPMVDVLVMGDELLHEGPSGGGRLRDSISPQVSGWLASVGARVGSVQRVADDQDAAIAALLSSTAEVVITTGGTAHGPVDQLHPALSALKAELIVDQVAVRPGHPMLLARLEDGRPLLGLPGNPLAAAVGFVSLGWPLIEAICGLPMTIPTRAALVGTITAPGNSHRLMPVRTTAQGDQSAPRVQPLLHHGPAMLSGLAAADALAIAPPGGTGSGELVDVLRLPWVR